LMSVIEAVSCLRKEAVGVLLSRCKSGSKRSVEPFEKLAHKFVDAEHSEFLLGVLLCAACPAFYNPAGILSPAGARSPERHGSPHSCAPAHSVHA